MGLTKGVSNLLVVHPTTTSFSRTTTPTSGEDNNCGHIKARSCFVLLTSPSLCDTSPDTGEE